MINRRIIRLISVCLVLSILYGSTYHSIETTTMQLDNVKVLTFVANGVGDIHFDIKNQLEAWGWNVTTAGLTENVTSCPNKPQKDVPVDILISDVDRNLLSQYNCVYISPGAQHHILAYNQEVLDLISTAYEEGLVVSSICVGNIVLAKANNILNGIKVASHYYVNSHIEAVGGLVEERQVVSDSRIITGGAGGGPTGGGNLLAPTYEFCVAIAKEILGYSYIQKTTVDTSSIGTDIKNKVDVETRNITELFTDINPLMITPSSVTISVYEQDGTTSLKTIVLKDLDKNGVYSGNFSGLEKGDYRIDIEVIDFGGGLEVVKNALRFSIGLTSTSSDLNTETTFQTDTSDSTGVEDSSSPSFEIIFVIFGLISILTIKRRK